MRREKVEGPSRRFSRGCSGANATDTLLDGEAGTGGGTGVARRVRRWVGRAGGYGRYGQLRGAGGRDDLDGQRLDERRGRHLGR